MILAPDPAVPQRDALLDERAMARRLGAARCERINAKYRVGDSLRVVYRADADRILAGRTFRGRSASVFRRAAAASEPGAVLHLEELETVSGRSRTTAGSPGCGCSTAAAARSRRSSAPR